MIDFLRNVRRKILHTGQVLELKLQSARPPLRVIIGAGNDRIPGWMSTDITTLNILEGRDWGFYFPLESIETILAEHVWEHLTSGNGFRAATMCFSFLKPGGLLRIAVPDGFHPHASYIDSVRPFGTGPGAEDHKMLYDHESLGALLDSAGFQTRALEYFDKSGSFHQISWDQKDGPVQRCSTDSRNSNGVLNYTSLIVDAIKPKHRAQTI